MSKKIKKGDKIRISGKETEFDQIVESMQVDHKNIEVAKKGDSIGLKVDQEVKENDIVYIIS